MQAFHCFRIVTDIDPHTRNVWGIHMINFQTPYDFSFWKWLCSVWQLILITKDKKHRWHIGTNNHILSSLWVSHLFISLIFRLKNAMHKSNRKEWGKTINFGKPCSTKGTESSLLAMEGIVQNQLNNLNLMQNCTNSKNQEIDIYREQILVFSHWRWEV